MEITFSEKLLEEPTNLDMSHVNSKTGINNIVKRLGQSFLLKTFLASFKGNT